MNDTAIRIAGLGKQYHLGVAGANYATLRDQLRRWTTSSLGTLLRRGQRAESKPSFWALKDVSFDVKQGDVVGIIGRNGSGKTTLLKILSRITEPTEGTASVRGRVGSLLEVGTGFHGELSGRENVFLNGAILGMSRAEILSRFDQIVAFAEVEKFIDTPVKHYSIGMYVRLAFAVAAHLEPEILIVDEVLAVGDAEFQAKCLGKLGSVADSGRTVLFVSHNMQAVSSLCNRGVVLSEGRLQFDGSAEEAIMHYGRNQAVATTEWSGEAGDENAVLLHTAVDSGTSDPMLRTDREIQIRMSLKLKRPILGFICAVELYNKHGAALVYSSYDDALPPPAAPIAPGDYDWTVTIPPDTLAAGNYEVVFEIGIHYVKKIVQREGALRFQVENINGIGRRFLAHDNIVRPAWEWTRR
jgi:lipopolysaccharide transport system ATP-binding protein